MRRKLAMISAVLGVSAAVVGSGWGLGTAVAGNGTPTGDVRAAGVLVTYSDRETFFPSSTTEPPTTTAPHAVTGFDTTGTGFAQAALVYNPYEDAPGAVNGLSPPGAPQVPAAEMKAKSQATVRGAPPQSHDASLTPAGATVTAALEEAGPSAVANAALVAASPAPGVEVRSAVTRARLSKDGGKSSGVATTVLKGVTLNQALHFDSITLESSSLADGGPGAAAAVVNVVGGAVNGTPVELTDRGLVVSDTSQPFAADAVRDALKQAGIELLLPGGSSSKAEGAHSVAQAKGPSFVLQSQGGQRLQVTLGVADSDVELFQPGGTAATADQQAAAPSMPVYAKET